MTLICNQNALVFLSFALNFHGNQAAVGMLFCVHMKAHDYDDEILITLCITCHFKTTLEIRCLPWDIMKPVNPCISCRITLKHHALVLYIHRVEHPLQHKLIQICSGLILASDILYLIKNICDDVWHSRSEGSFFVQTRWTGSQYLSSESVTQTLYQRFTYLTS